MGKKSEKLEVIQALEMEEGKGAKVKRLFPTHNKRNFDPFVLMDEFFVEPPAGFPEHPHRGFEGITYMLEGGFQHSDNLGNESTVYAGGLQCFTAGKGLKHSELPAREGVNHGIQLWVNLPKAKKQIEPTYQQIDTDQIHEEQNNGNLIRTIAGDQKGPLQLHTDVLYQHYQLDGAQTVTKQIGKGFKGYVYVLKGSMQAQNGNKLEEGQALFFESLPEIKITSKGSVNFILLAGRPHGEPIRHWGPFVD
jgi:redox-sensitive bicupin YhaK (pirin superfamily)